MKIANSNDILFCGDTHGNLTGVQRMIDKLKPKAVVLLGDIQPEEPLQDLLTGCEVHWITGNHDADKPCHYENLVNSHYGANNLHARVVEVAGVRIAGLGGVFDNEIWHPPSEPLYENVEHWAEMNRYRDPYFDKHLIKHQHCSIFYDDYLKLMVEEADILVVHDAPSCHPYGYQAIDELAQAMGVKKVFHGDHHDSLDYSADTERMGFETHGVGLRGVTSISGIRVLEGELDRNRFSERMTKKANKESFFVAPRRFAM